MMISLVQEIAASNGFTVQVTPITRPSGYEGKPRTYAYKAVFTKGNLTHTRVLPYYQPSQLATYTNDYTKRTWSVLGKRRLELLNQELALVSETK